MLTLDEWLIRFRASCKRDDGQAMAEYAAASVSIFTVFSSRVEGAITG